MRKLIFIVGLIITGVLVVSCRPVKITANHELPSAESIIDRYVEATGGVEAYKKIKNTFAKGAAEFVAPGAPGITGDLTMAAAAGPGFRLLVVDIPGVGKVGQVCNGKIVWEYNLGRETSLLKGKELEEILFGAKFKIEDWRDSYKSVETRAIETVEGEECYSVMLTSKVGTAETRYFSKATGLLVRIDFKSHRGVNVEEAYKDYRSVDGVLKPFQAVQKINGQTNSIMTYKEIKHNTDLPESMFEPPAEVKALFI